MGAGVVAPRTAEGEVELPRCVAGRGVHASEVVAHDLLADQVGADVGRQPGGKVEVFAEVGVVLVLFVEAVAVGVESRGVERPAVVEPVAHDDLVVDLQVVVRLVVVVIDLLPFGVSVVAVVDRVVASVLGAVHAARVVTAAVVFHFVFRHAVVGEVGFGLAAEREQFDDRPSVVVSGLEHIGLEVRRAAVDVAVRSDVRQAGVHHPMIAQQSRGDAHGLLVGVVRTVGERGFAAEVGPDGRRGHVHRTAESARAVGRDARAALHLDASHRGDQVGRVVPIDRMRVGVVHRNAVHRDVQARGVRAAEADRSASDPDARLVRGDHRGCERQQRRNVESVAVTGDFVVREVREGHGGLLGGARGRHLDLLHPVDPQRVVVRSLRGGGCGMRRASAGRFCGPELRGRAERGGREHRKNNPFHRQTF